MPLGYRGGSEEAYGVKLAAALSEAPGVKGVQALLASSHSYEALVEALKTLPVAEWVDDLSSPRGVEKGLRRWLADKLAKAEPYVPDRYEILHEVYSMLVASRDLTLVLRLAYQEAEPPPPDDVVTHACSVTRTVYHLFLETRSYRALLERLEATRYRRLAENLQWFTQVMGINGVDAAIDYTILETLHVLLREVPDLHTILCYRNDSFYLRIVINVVLHGVPREAAARLLERVKPCRLPDLKQEALMGDEATLAMRLHSTAYGEARGGLAEVASRLEALIRKASRRTVTRNIGEDVSTIEFAASALEYLLLDLEDVSMIFNGVYSGASRQELEEVVSVAGLQA